MNLSAVMRPKIARNATNSFKQRILTICNTSG